MKANDTCILIADAIRSEGLHDVTTQLGVKSAFTLVYSLLFIFGLIGNGGVVYAMARNRRLRSARNIFLLNLILTDLLLVLTAVPVTPWYALTKTWEFGSAMCRIMPLSNSCSVFVTRYDLTFLFGKMSWSLTAISIDKYLHIIDPTLAPVTKRQSLAITLLIWLISTLINVPYLLSYELVDGSYYVPKNRNKVKIMLVTEICNHIIIGVTVLIYFAKVIRYLSSLRHFSTPYCGRFCDETNWQSENSRRLYGTMVMLLQVNYILIGMVATFICCWLPLTAVNLVKDYKIEPDFLRSQPFLWPLVAHIIAMSLVVWNPVLFFWLTRKQKRSGLRKIINSSEVIATFANRCSLTIRRMSGRRSSKLHQSQKRSGTIDSEAATCCASSRPLVIKTEVIDHSLANLPEGFDCL
ncbi:7 transmembrane receptor [Dictyocaulus viviparus]|uniref:7 transmembrane receptor n=1 Tax=Dictyocaulus viviparus TaxID=29172 RepID=A0A0D8XSL0_DICVI|nr:7 transmembrane receptor [Dictyocaulus viviparus]